MNDPELLGWPRTTVYGGADLPGSEAVRSAELLSSGGDRHRTIGRRLEKDIGRPRAEAGVAPPGARGLPLPEFSTERAESAESQPATGARRGAERGRRRAEPPDSGEVQSDDNGQQDPWFASFGTKISSVLSSGRSIEASTGAGTMISEIIMGADDRLRVQNTRAIPYRWTCCLTILAANGTRWMGTGWFAAPRLVVTAGHCVYLHNHGGWVASVGIQPARNGGDVPFSLECTGVLSVRGWVEDKRSDSDYGALVLAPTEADNEIGHYGYATLPDVQLRQELVNVAGYPLDKPVGTLWGHARVLSDTTANELIYQNDTYGGMSGAPVIWWDGQEYLVLGIHNYGDVTGNRATRITPEVYHNLQAWTSWA